MSDTPWLEDNESSAEIIPRKTIYEIMRMRPIKLELGGGQKPVGGYINVDKKDLPQVDFIADITTLEDFVDGSVDAILARDVIQCFHREELVTILRCWFRKMRRASRLVLQIPDMKQIFTLYMEGKVCYCWASATKRANDACEKCKGKAVLNYDKFQNYLYGRNRDFEMFKSAYDITDLTAIVEKVGFTVMETQVKDLRFLIVAKKIVKKVEPNA